MPPAGRHASTHTTCDDRLTFHWNPFADAHQASAGDGAAVAGGALRAHRLPGAAAAARLAARAHRDAERADAGHHPAAIRPPLRRASLVTCAWTEMSGVQDMSRFYQLYLTVAVAMGIIASLLTCRLVATSSGDECSATS